MPATRCQSSGPLGALLSSPALDVRLITALQVLQVHEVLQFVPDQLSRYGAWLWYAFARPQSEWANARAHTALCAALSSSERDRRSCATTIVVVPATHTVNKDTGLSGRGLHRHTVVVRRAQQLAIAQYLPGASLLGRHWDGLPAFSDWHARTMCCRRGAGLLVARRHSMRGWTCSPDPASCRCRTLAQATRQEDL